MRPRILIFSHDGRGLGHLRRLSRLAAGLQRSASVLVVTGHREASWLVPPECEFVHIPSLDSIEAHRSKGWNREPFIRDDPRVGRRIRRALLASTLSEFKPDALIVDYLPLGVEDELAEAIFSERATYKKFYISRGVLGDPTTIRRSILSPSPMGALRTAYDRIIVMADERIINTSVEYSLDKDIADKIITVGYAATRPDIARVEEVRNRRKKDQSMPWVVCSAGGGRDGEDLIERCWELTSRFPECLFDVIIGSRSRLRLRETSLHENGRVRVVQSDPDNLALLHASADVVITRGGYNSLIEACMGHARIIAAPIRTDYEQCSHSARLSTMRPITICDDISKLDVVLDSVLEDRETSASTGSTLDVAGVERACRLIIHDLTCAASVPSINNQISRLTLEATV